MQLHISTGNICPSQNNRRAMTPEKTTVLNIYMDWSCKKRRKSRWVFIISLKKFSHMAGKFTIQFAMHHRAATVCWHKPSSKIPLHDAGDKSSLFYMHRYFGIINLTNSSRISYISHESLLDVVCVPVRESERDEVSGKMRTEKSWNSSSNVRATQDDVFTWRFFFSLLFGNVFFMNLYCASFFISSWERIKGNWISWRE